MGCRPRQGQPLPDDQSRKERLIVNGTQPISPVTCEIFRDAIDQTSDPCPHLVDEHVYRYSQSFNPVDKSLWKEEDKGSSSNFL